MTLEPMKPEAFKMKGAYDAMEKPVGTIGRVAKKKRGNAICRSGRSPNRVRSNSCSFYEFKNFGKLVKHKCLCKNC